MRIYALASTGDRISAFRLLLSVTKQSFCSPMSTTDHGFMDSKKANLLHQVEPIGAMAMSMERAALSRVPMSMMVNRKVH